MGNASKSEIAAAQKARARFGLLFTKEKYAVMASCKNVTEVAAMLRENPAYAQALSAVKETALNREVLEDVIKSQLYEDFASLFGFDYALGSKLWQLAVVDCENSIIMNYARLFNAGKVASFRPKMPEFFERHIGLNLSLLAEANDWNGLMSAVKRRDLLHIVSLCRPKENEPLDLSSLEFLLKDYFCAKVIEIAGGDEKILKVFGTNADFQNIQFIIRAKQYFGAQPEMLTKHILQLHNYFTKKKLFEMCTMSVDEIFDELADSPYKEYFVSRDIPVVTTGNRIVWDMCRKSIHYETDPSALLSGYMLLAKNQYDCLTTVIEGIRYAMPGDKIMELLPI